MFETAMSHHKWSTLEYYNLCILMIFATWESYESALHVSIVPYQCDCAQKHTLNSHGKHYRLTIHV